MCGTFFHWWFLSGMPPRKLTYPLKSQFWRWMSFFPKGVYVNSQEGRCKSALCSHHCEAAFRHVTQRVQELADALHEEQRKHLSMRYVWTFVGAVFDGQRDDVAKFPWNAVFQSFQSGICYINRIKISMLNTLDCYTKHLPTNYVAPNFYPNFEWWPGDNSKPQLILAWLFLHLPLIPASW